VTKTARSNPKPERLYTLDDLWKKSGGKPFKARFSGWAKGEWFRAMGRAPMGLSETYGYCEDGCAIGFVSNYRNWLPIDET
jgi:hypothetical protein